MMTEPHKEDFEPNTPSPRAFAVWVGRGFVAVGFLLALGTCCFWSVGGSVLEKVVSNSSATGAAKPHVIGGDVREIVGVAMVGGLVGGMGFLAAGVGLVGELRRSGIAAMTVSGIMAGVWITCAVFMYRLEAGPAVFWPTVFLAFVALVLLVFGVMAAGVLAAFPPPADQSVVRDDVLEKMKAKRRH